MRASTLLLALVLALAVVTAAARRKKGPWFCRGRSCPHFKTVGWAGRNWSAWDAPAGLGRAGRGQPLAAVC